MTRILVVEDSPTQAEVARAVLEDAGFEVELAPDGEAGLQRLCDSHFDLVISDIVMPGMSGYELSREIKRSEQTKSIPVILLTTLNDPMDIIRGLECNADNFITKPFEPAYLVDRIRTLLENKAVRGAEKLKVGVEIVFLGQRFTVTSDKEQILDLLVATFEDIVRTNRSLQETQAELSAANAKIEEYARALEGRARRSEEKYRNLMEQVGDAILIFDRSGILLELNAAAERLLGRTAEGLVGRHIGDAVCAEAAKRFELFVAGDKVQETPFDLPLPSDGVRIVDCSMSAVDAGGQPLVVKIIRDITERRDMEHRVQQAEKMEAVARLASGAAHDFNNVLMAILTFADVLLRKMPADDPGRRPAEEIKAAAKRGSWLTGQLLAFSRSRHRTSEPVNVNDVIGSMAEMLRNLVGEDKTLEMQLGSEPAMVELEPGHVEQLAMNLVVNARDATPTGGTIRVEIRTEPSDGDPAAAHDGQKRPHVIISVSDTGHGISDETKARLFQPFFTTKEKGRGTGLGLAIVDAIVTERGGRISVESEREKGTTFMIRLPQADSAP